MQVCPLHGIYSSCVHACNPILDGQCRAYYNSSSEITILQFVINNDIFKTVALPIAAYYIKPLMRDCEQKKAFSNN